MIEWRRPSQFRAVYSIVGILFIVNQPCRGYKYFNLIFTAACLLQLYSTTKISRVERCDQYSTSVNLRFSAAYLLQSYSITKISRVERGDQYSTSVNLRFSAAYLLQSYSNESQIARLGRTWLLIPGDCLPTKSQNYEGVRNVLFFIYWD
jgi:hypothetical protein